VVFTSSASDLISDASNDTNELTDVLIYDIDAGVVSLVSHSFHSPLIAADSQSSSPSISRDGTEVVFETYASDILEGEFLSVDVFLYDVLTGQRTLVSHRYRPE
jgi:Tol biopolymer transport system component